MTVRKNINGSKTLNPEMKFQSQFLLYEIYTLPTKISNELHKDIKTDTIVKNTVTTASIETKSNLLYINGNIISPPIKISDNYSFSPDNPNEFYDGYFYEIQTIKGGKYYIWKQTDEFKTNTQINYQMNLSEKLWKALPK